MKKILVILLLSITLCSCSADGVYNYEPNPGGDPAETIPTASIERKLVYTYSCTLYATDFQKAIDDLLTLKDTYANAYVETFNKSSDDYGLVATYKIRVKSEDVSDFISKLPALGTIRNEHLSSTDLTADYIDLVAKKASKEAELTRLYEFLNNAANYLEANEISKSIASVEAELNTINNTLANIDALVTYSSLTITISSKAAPAEDESFGDQVKTAFVGMWKGTIAVLKFLVLAIIYTFPLGLLALAIVYTIRFFKKIKINKKNKTS